MHFVLVGPGALGCLLTAVIQRGVDGDSFQLLDHNESRAIKIDQDGIQYKSDEDISRYPIDATINEQDIRMADVLFICVKSYDLATCIDRCLSFISPHTLVIFLQNGVGHLHYADELKRGIPVFGTTSEGAHLIEPGFVNHAGRGETCLGFPKDYAPNDAERLNEVIALLKRGGLQIDFAENVIDRLWAKLFVNVGINALTALHGVQNGQLLTDSTLITEMQKAVREAENVARHFGVKIGLDPVSQCEKVCKMTAANVSSMLQDVRKKRKTEIDSINGVIVKKGDEMSIDVAVNRSLTKRVKVLEKSYLE